MTNTDICNMALSYIAKGRITSLDERTEQARQCKLHYDHLRKMLLRRYTWGFAKRVNRLARLDTGIPGWEYVYAYPQKCLSIRLIYNEQNAEKKEMEKSDFDVVIIRDNVKAVACHVENAFAEYTYDTTDAEIMSEDFIEALSRLLASTIAMTLTGNANIQQMNYQLFQVAMQGAQTTMAQEREKKPEFPHRYADARFS